MCFTRLCDTQRLSLEGVERLNAIALKLGREHGIMVWDLSPLTLSAGHAEAQDSVHPAKPATAMWSAMLHHLTAMASSHRHSADFFGLCPP